jgi:hypothetical protein
MQHDYYAFGYQLAGFETSFTPFGEATALEPSPILVKRLPDVYISLTTVVQHPSFRVSNEIDLKPN